MCDDLLQYIFFLVVLVFNLTNTYESCLDHGSEASDIKKSPVVGAVGIQRTFECWHRILRSFYFPIVHSVKGSPLVRWTHELL